MKTHKVRYVGYDYYLGGFDGSFTTYCGISEDCSEELSENYIVGEHDECTCKKCNRAYNKAMDKLDAFDDIVKLLKTKYKSINQ